MKTLKKTVAATLVTLLFTGFALAGENEKGKRKGKGKSKNKAPAVKVESGAAELNPLTKGLGLNEKNLQLFAESLGAENGGELAKMGAKIFGDILSTEEGRAASQALAESGAKIFSQMMAGENGAEPSVDLSQLMGDGAELPAGLAGLLQSLAGGDGKPLVKASAKAIIIGPDGKRREVDLSGIGNHHKKRLEWRKHEGPDHDDGEEEHKDDYDDEEDEVVELLEEISEQMGRQNDLLEEILEHLEE